MNLNAPATRQTLAARLAMPSAGDPLVDERLEVIRALSAELQILERGRAKRADVKDLLAQFDEAIAISETNVRSLGERLLQLQA